LAVDPELTSEKYVSTCTEIIKLTTFPFLSKIEEEETHAGDLQWVGAVIRLGKEKEKISSDLAGGRD
jgi:hypothetical protein